MTTQLFTAASTMWTVPADTHSVQVDLIGGGAGGTNGIGIFQTSGGNGGGGGGVSSQTFPVTPGDVYVVNVGTGGQGGVYQGFFQPNGGASSFYQYSPGATALLIAGGGTGTPSYMGGYGNVSNGGDGRLSGPFLSGGGGGGAGEGFVNSGVPDQSGGVGANGGGNGGNGATFVPWTFLNPPPSLAPGQNGQSPGGGGGGGTATNAGIGSQSNGGGGAAGSALLTWTATPNIPPSAPTITQVIAGNASATISWSVPASAGSSPITGYTVTSSPGGVTGSVGPTVQSIVLSGLTNGTSYTFTVVATSAAGSSLASASSQTVVPSATAPPPPPPVPPGGSSTVITKVMLESIIFIATNTPEVSAADLATLNAFLATFP